MKTIKTKKVPVIAGMPFLGKSTKLQKVGYDIIEFTYNLHGQLIAEKRIKRVFTS
jgi:adenylate kinase